MYDTNTGSGEITNNDINYTRAHLYIQNTDVVGGVFNHMETRTTDLEYASLGNRKYVMMQSRMKTSAVRK